MVLCFQWDLKDLLVHQDLVIHCHRSVQRGLKGHLVQPVHDLLLDQMIPSPQYLQVNQLDHLGQHFQLLLLPPFLQYLLIVPSVPEALRGHFDQSAQIVLCHL